MKAETQRTQKRHVRSRLRKRSEMYLKHTSSVSVSVWLMLLCYSRSWTRCRLMTPCQQKLGSRVRMMTTLTSRLHSHSLSPCQLPCLVWRCPLLSYLSVHFSSVHRNLCLPNLTAKLSRTWHHSPCVRFSFLQNEESDDDKSRRTAVRIEFQAAGPDTFSWLDVRIGVKPFSALMLPLGSEAGHLRVSFVKNLLQKSQRFSLRDPA